MSLDKVEKFPFFPPLGRFTRSAVGLWEGAAVARLLPPALILFTQPLLFLSVRPLPPFADLSGSSSTPSLVFSVRGLHRFHSPPSFVVEPPVGGNRQGGESEAVEEERHRGSGEVDGLMESVGQDRSFIRGENKTSLLPFAVPSGNKLLFSPCSLKSFSSDAAQETKSTPRSEPPALRLPQPLRSFRGCESGK